MSEHEVLTNDQVAVAVHRLVVSAPRIAEIRSPGQFVIVHLGPRSERIPLTIADADPDAGTIVLYVQNVGKSTADLVALPPGSFIHDVAGPLGRPSDLLEHGRAVCVAGGVGAAVILPIARGLAQRGVELVTVLGARTATALVLEDELAAIGSVVTCTDDGTAGRRGFVTDALEDVVDAAGVDRVYAAGPVPMMRAVAELTAARQIRTIVSLNPLMVDGTGMCGGCRVTVAGRMRFACVDGPEFDARGVDFDELLDRLGTYRDAEDVARRRVGA
jgi:ferredoxin/flavodoxin---NADP+ reductase